MTPACSPPTTTSTTAFPARSSAMVSGSIIGFLSYRDVQELLFARGIDVTHEAIRQWGRKFGQEYANQLRPDSLAPGINGM